MLYLDVCNYNSKIPDDWGDCHSAAELFWSIIYTNSGRNDNF